MNDILKHGAHGVIQLDTDRLSLPHSERQQHWPDQPAVQRHSAHPPQQPHPPSGELLHHLGGEQTLFSFRGGSDVVGPIRELGACDWLPHKVLDLSTNIL